MLQPGSELVIATRNRGKVEELAKMFAAKQIRIKSLLDYPLMPDIPEDADTFAGNALIKAQAVAKELNVFAIADDSGLCVDQLKGAPGVYSARYAGEHASDEENNRKLLRELAAVQTVPASFSAYAHIAATVLSTARFVSAIALVDASGNPLIQTEGICEGLVISEPRGSAGFGYDPLFFIPELGRSMAELTTDEKNKISHRGRAIEQLWKALQTA